MPRYAHAGPCRRGRNRSDCFLCFFVANCFVRDDARARGYARPAIDQTFRSPAQLQPKTVAAKERKDRRDRTLFLCVLCVLSRQPIKELPAFYIASRIERRFFGQQPMRRVSRRVPTYRDVKPARRCFGKGGLGRLRGEERAGQPPPGDLISGPGTPRLRRACARIQRRVMTEKLNVRSKLPHFSAQPVSPSERIF